MQSYAGRFLWLIIFNLFFAIAGAGNNNPCYTETSHIYNRADKLFNLSNPTDETDSHAILLFQQVIDKLETSACYNEILLFHAYVKKGILLDVQGRYVDAKNAYLNAVHFNKANHSVNDSLIFRTYVYTGSAYYHLNNFDSARFFLRKAEVLINLSTISEDKARLYNALGALYYDNGNYNQSKNYFRQALALLKDKTPLDTVSAVNISTNIATAFYKLGDYNSSLGIYNDILKYKVSANYIYMNMGRANAGLKKYTDALQCFRKVNALELPGVYNEMAFVQLELKQTDSSVYFLDRLESLLNQKNIRVNNLDIAINQLYRAEVFIQRKQYHTTLNCLQKAIMLFSNFKNSDIYSNPSRFTEAFAYYRLFEALFQKAMVFELMYKTNPQVKYLRASYEVYELTLRLLDYIEKTYDTDDAKLLLKKRSRQIYEKAIFVCIELQRLQPDSGYLEKAFLISERNKGSVVASNLKEQMISRMNAEEASLTDRTKNIKYNIARLNVKLDLSHDKTEIEGITREKEGYEIELSLLYKQLEQNSKYYKLKYDDSYPRIKDLQEKLTGDQALISFYATPVKLHAFIITSNSTRHVEIDSFPVLQQRITDWLNLLRNTESGRKFKGQIIGNKIYQQLIHPLKSNITQKNEWIIIPDGILYFLPFESLPVHGSSASLVETTVISYQLSSRFISAIGKKALPGTYSSLAFAPFAGQSNLDPAKRGIATWNRLPASWEEIKDLEGVQYRDYTATKEKFLKDVNTYPVVHLATHAVANINNAAGSYIAFYPHSNSLLEDRLYLEELYGLQMDATKLVIVSACETGDGELVNNEGVISLARGFAYAGCASSINSLWKANDKATCEILKQFHVYLKQGYTKSKALQLAKIDYIKKSEHSKNPGYWSNLILIGDIEPICEPPSKTKWALIFLSVPGILLLAAVRMKKKVDAIHKQKILRKEVVRT
ncbi:MAG: CHAT domain-containing protein [Chitinophagaceae bacterium]|nr:CHAT domain-containing protein [Chitinophagaceae bacterium]